MIATSIRSMTPYPIGIIGPVWEGRWSCLSVSPPPSPPLFIKMASAAIIGDIHISRKGVSGNEKYNWGTLALCGASAIIIWKKSHRCVKPVTEHLLLARLLQ